MKFYSPFLSRCCLAVLCYFLPAFPAVADEPPAARPNFLLIISDDQRFDSLHGFMPQTEERIFARGIEFERAYATTSACCPSRSSMYTGLYACRHMVRLNEDRLIFKTVFDDLKAAGYATAIAGKYLNSWPGRPRPEFDFWAVFPYGSMIYNRPIININGELKRRDGYITDLLRDQALEFIDRQNPGGSPFMLVFAPNAPHSPAVPAEQDSLLYRDMPLYRPPGWGQKAPADKPAWLKRRKIDRPELARTDELRLRQYRTLASLDRAVGSLLDRLEARQLLSSTVVMFISDNGLMWGEFGLVSKGYAYEPSVRVPFAITYPGLIEQPRLESALVANIDIAPTIYELAGIQSGTSLDGMSLVPLLRGETSNWRTQLLIEGWVQNGGREPFTAVHTGRYKYIENRSSEPELYDLLSDPYELDNLQGEPGYAQLQSTLKRDLKWKRHELKARLRTDLARLRARMSSRFKGAKKRVRILAARALHRARARRYAVDPQVRIHLAAVFGADSREARDPFQDYDDYR